MESIHSSVPFDLVQGGGRGLASGRAPYGHSVRSVACPAEPAYLVRDLSSPLRMRRCSACRELQHFLLEMRVLNRRRRTHMFFAHGGRSGAGFISKRRYWLEIWGSPSRGPAIRSFGTAVCISRTIRGLVSSSDVIYRRIESAFLDPITVPGAGAMGVPGLINASGGRGTSRSSTRRSECGGQSCATSIR